jgi:hypothetical protein
MVFLFVVLWSVPALASDIWGATCAHTGADTVAAPAVRVDLIGAGEHASSLKRFACLGWGTAITTSQVLTVRADSVLFCFVDDVAGTSGTADVMIEKCIGDANVAANTNTCIDILDADLTGLAGSDATQNACVRAGPGRYRAVTTAGASGDFPVLTAEAEE